MTAPGLSGTAARRSVTDCYALLLAASLMGLAFMGKGFAYAGVPPLFVTEAVLALGLLVLLRTGCLVALFSNTPMLLLAGLISLGALGTVPYVSRHGVDALRDSVLALYGLFAFITAALLLERPERLVLSFRLLQLFTQAFVFIGPVAFLLNRTRFLEQLPGWPGSAVPFLFVRAGEVGVHLSACVVMALLGLRSARPVWVGGLLFGIVVVSSQSRGGMLAILGPTALALVAARRWRQACNMLAAGVVVLGLVYVADFNLPLGGDDQRNLNVSQIVDNMVSIVAPSDSGNLDGTKAWRVRWWKYIQDYTFSGSYFWTGKGFGINLAVADGFVVGEANSPPLRSPHNSHVTLLARLGVPGLVLWCLVGLSWFWMMLSCMHTARRQGQDMWSNFMLLIACYWLSIVIDASFDVALEGPMLGVWFWCLFGAGAGAVMIYRAQGARTWSVRAGFPAGLAPKRPRHSTVSNRRRL